MTEEVLNFISTSDQSQLSFQGTHFTEEEIMLLYNRIAHSNLKEEQIEQISQSFLEELPKNLVVYLYEYNSQVCNLAEEYKLRRFALIFDPSKQNVYERLIDRTQTVRTEAMRLAIEKAYLNEDKVAERLVAVLQNSDFKSVEWLLNLYNEEEASSPYFEQYIDSIKNKIENVQILFNLQVDLYEIYLRNNEEFAKAFVEKFNNNEMPVTQLITLLNSAVHSEKFEFIIQNSVNYENILEKLYFLNNLLCMSKCNENIFKNNLLNKLHESFEEEVLESFGFFSLLIYCKKYAVKDLQMYYMNCFEFQQTQQRSENAAILLVVLQVLESNANVQEYQGLINDILLHCFAQIKSFAPYEQQICINFMAGILQHEEFLGKNGKKFMQLLEECYKSMNVLYELSMKNEEQAFGDITLILKTASLATSIISQISNFDSLGQQCSILIFKIRSVLSNFVSILSKLLFTFKIELNADKLRQLYIETIQSVNICLLTPGQKDYNFDLIGQWAVQLLLELDIYSSETFLRSLVYVKDQAASQSQQKSNAEIIYITVANCVDLVNLQLLFKMDSEIGSLVKEIARLIYHCGNSQTLGQNINIEYLLLDLFQPIYAKMINFTSFEPIAPEVGCLLGLLKSTSARKDYLLRLFADLQLESNFSIISGILAGICCVYETFKFGEEESTAIEQEVLELAQVCPIPPVFLCLRQTKDDKFNKQLLSVIEQQLKSLQEGERSACQLYMQKLQVAVEVDNEREGTIRKHGIIQEITATCRACQQFLNDVYEQ